MLFKVRILNRTINSTDFLILVNTKSFWWARNPKIRKFFWNSTAKTINHSVIQTTQFFDELYGRRVDLKSINPRLALSWKTHPDIFSKYWKTYPSRGYLFKWYRIKSHFVSGPDDFSSNRSVPRPEILKTVIGWVFQELARNFANEG